MNAILKMIIDQLKRVLPDKARVGIGVALVMILGIVEALGPMGIAPEVITKILEFKETILLIAGAFGVSGGAIMIQENTETARSMRDEMRVINRSFNAAKSDD